MRQESQLGSAYIQMSRCSSRANAEFRREIPRLFTEAQLLPSRQPQLEVIMEKLYLQGVGTRIYGAGIEKAEPLGGGIRAIPISLRQ